ncbi:hypothetical protein M422DRAFT_179617, partial [Sphaerobolus stellatus SS14]
ETLGAQPLGKTLHDRTSEAYGTYGVDPTKGAIIILRPDGLVGFIATLDQHEEISKYFSEFVQPRLKDVRTLWDHMKPAQQEDMAIGEISVEGEAEETKLSSQI